MERRFNSENFEKSLKTHADEFKMMPSKKVWRGIYNDLHPGTRWPSIAMSLVFIFTLVIIGHLNTNNSKILAALNSSQNQSITPAIASKKKIRNHTSHQLNNNAVSFNNNNNKNNINVIADNSIQSILLSDQNLWPVFHMNNYTNSSVNNISFDGNNNTIFNPSDAIFNPGLSAIIKKDNDVAIKNVHAIPTNFKTEEDNLNTAGENTNENSGSSLIINTNKTTDKKKETTIALNKKALEEKQHIKNSLKETIEKKEEKTSGSSFLSISKKVRDKISVSYYISPSINYRNLSEKNFASNPNQITASTSAPGFTNINTIDDVINKPIIGLEIGSALNYKLSKRWQVTAGVQLDYAGYNIEANNVHPVSTSLRLISDFTGYPYAFNAISYYGNGSNTTHTTLHQYSLQASVPFGFKYMIVEANNLQFNIESTFQPSYIIASKAYLLSFDKRNYVTESSLLRTLNMSTNVGTYVSFKSNNFKWQIGPQVFYQLLSTYTHNYPTQEHLINYGIKFGISKLKN